jgi:cytochrome c6
MRSALLAVLLALAAGATAADKSASRDAGAAGEGRRLFTAGTTPPCSTCHALRDAGATGSIGPDLDALQPDAARVANAVKNGFEAMPAFGHALSGSQIDTLSKYVAQAAGK